MPWPETGDRGRKGNVVDKRCKEQTQESRDQGSPEVLELKPLSYFGRKCACKFRMALCCYVSHSALSDSLRPHGLQPARLLCPWNSPGKNPGMSGHSLLQGIFPSQGLNPGLLHCRQILYCEPPGKPRMALLKVENGANSLNRKRSFLSLRPEETSKSAKI